MKEGAEGHEGKGPAGAFAAEDGAPRDEACTSDDCGGEGEEPAFGHERLVCEQDECPAMRLEVIMKGI